MYSDSDPHALTSSDRWLLKVGGGMAVGGGVLEFLGNVLHPRSTGYYDDPVAWLDHNVDSDIWFPSHMLILLGSMIVIGGFVALSRSLAGTDGQGVANLALASALVGSTLLVVTLVIDGLVVPELEGVWTADSASSADAVLSGTILYYTIFNFLYAFMITLFGLAPILYGVAMLLGKVYARWMGWVGIAAGSAVIVSALLSMVDVQRKTLDASIWPVTSSTIVAWFVVLGVLMWRRASAPSASAVTTATT
jgi:hypothetical protein